MMFGRPSFFTHRLPGFWGALPGTPNDVALYDHAPLRATLERLVDFELVNRADIRLSICCVDIETGDEVVFDNRRDRIGPEHILASAAITPGFPPVVIDGRMLCDPGYVNNTPLDVAFATPPDRDTLCIVVELFSLRTPRPASLDAVLERTQDVIFASPTRRTVATLHREYSLRAELGPAAPPSRCCISPTKPQGTSSRPRRSTSHPLLSAIAGRRECATWKRLLGSGRKMGSSQG